MTMMFSACASYGAPDHRCSRCADIDLALPDQQLLVTRVAELASIKRRNAFLVACKALAQSPALQASKTG